MSFATNVPEAREVTSNALWDYSRFEGRFSSDRQAWTEDNLIGDGSPQLDTGEIQLDVEYLGDGQYRGEIHSEYMAKHTFAQWSRVMLEGEMNVFGSVDFVMWDFVLGKRRSFALFSLSVEKPETGAVLLTPKRGGAFPGEVILWPTTFTMADGVRGEKFSEALRESTERNWDADGPERQLLQGSSETLEEPLR